MYKDACSAKPDSVRAFFNLGQEEGHGTSS